MARWMNAVSVHTNSKKGDLLHCANYRTVSLVSHDSKILLRVILEGMRSRLEGEIGQQPVGFRPNTGSRDQITNHRIILDKAKQLNHPLYFLFNWLHQSIWHGMAWSNVARNVGNGLPATFGRTTAWSMQTTGSCSENSQSIVRVIPDKKEVWQGCSLSPCLFNILAEQVIRRAFQGFAGGFMMGGKP